VLITAQVSWGNSVPRGHSTFEMFQSTFEFFLTVALGDKVGERRPNSADSVFRVLLSFACTQGSLQRPGCVYGPTRRPQWSDGKSRSDRYHTYQGYVDTSNGKDSRREEVVECTYTDARAAVHDTIQHLNILYSLYYNILRIYVGCKHQNSVLKSNYDVSLLSTVDGIKSFLPCLAI
jgi:hypothetical protein